MSPVRLPGSGTLRVSSGKLGSVVGGSFAQKWPPAATAQPRLTMTAAGMIQRNGVNYRKAGVNAFQLVHNDYPNSRLMTHAEIDTLLGKLATLKAGVVRAHTLGVNIGPSANHLVTGVSGTTSPVISYNAAVAEVMDYAVYVAGQLGLYLMVPMTDELAYYHGGKRQWVNFRRPGTVSLDGNVKSANSSTQRTAENYFYTDSQIRLDFKTYVSEWLNHVNQYTGVAYKNDPTIAIIETGNELWTSAQDAPGWAADLCQFIKGIAPNVLTADGAAADGAALNSTSLDSPYVDIFGTHPYTTFGPSNINSQAIQAAAKGKAYHIGEYPWSKSTAPDIESAARAAGNTFTTMFWSLQNDGDLHNGGPGQNYGTDDASLYVPGADATQQAAITRLQAHSQSLMDGAATAVPPTASGGTAGDITDAFTGTDGTAPTSAKWIVTGNSTGSTTTIQSNALRLRTGTSGGYGDKAVLISAATARVDQRVVFDATPTDLGEAYFQISLRSAAQDASIGDVTGYRLEVANDAGYISIARRGGGGVIGGGSGLAVPGWAAGVQAHFDYSVIGNRIRLWAWTSGSKPTSPLIDVTNSEVTAAGYNGFVLNGGNAAAARTMTLDNYALTSTLA